MDRSLGRYSFNVAPIAVDLRYRPSVNERFMSRNQRSGWGGLMQGLFYGLAFLDELREFPLLH